MAELMRHHSLELVPIEVLQRSAGTGHCRVVLGVTGSEGVDTSFLVEYEDLWDRNSGCDRHLFDNIPQATFSQIGCLRLDSPSAEQLSHCSTSTAKLRGAIGAPTADQDDHSHGDQKKESWIAPAASRELEGEEESEIDTAD
jgi:hypothetical protein